MDIDQNTRSILCHSNYIWLCPLLSVIEGFAMMIWQAILFRVSYKLTPLILLDDFADRCLDSHEQRWTLKSCCLFMTRLYRPTLHISGRHIIRLKMDGLQISHSKLRTRGTWQPLHRFNFFHRWFPSDRSYLVGAIYSTHSYQMKVRKREKRKYTKLALYSLAQLVCNMQLVRREKGTLASMT